VLSEKRDDKVKGSLIPWSSLMGQNREVRQGHWGDSPRYVSKTSGWRTWAHFQIRRTARSKKGKIVGQFQLSLRFGLACAFGV